MRLYDQAKACMTMKDQVLRRWMLHGNVSRKGYGNALIGRYGGCFEEGYKEAYDDRAYHAKDFDAPAKFALNLKVIKGNARYRRGSQNIYSGSENNRILTLVKRTHTLIISNSLVRRFTKRQVPLG